MLGLEAWLLVGLFGFALRLAPARVIRRVLRNRQAGREQGRLAARVDVAVEGAARWLPARAVTCLPRACAAHVMLVRRGARSSLRIGVLKRETGAVAAHAWVEAGGLEIGLDRSCPGFLTLPLP
jgi:hypothetical protein